jgi:ABC-2 type transport system ATP-binding protein
MSDILLATRDLRRSFGRRVVIDSVDLNVPEGKVYGFLGRNGSGKTTTIRCLLGILRPNSGTIRYGDVTAKQTTTAMKRGIGYVSQHQHFYDWMTCERIGRFVGAFYPTWDHKEYRSLLERTKMKLAMALALAHKPRLLILDEPTAGVDPVARAEILDTLRDEVRNHGRTVFFSTHHLFEVEQIGDVVGVLNQGALFYEGDLNGLADAVREVRPELPEQASLEAAFVAIARDVTP